MNQVFMSFRPMTVREIFTRSIQLCKENFLKFIGIILLVEGSYLILGYILRQIVVILVRGSAENAAITTANLDLAIDLALKAADIIFITPISIAAMTIAIASILLGEEIGVLDSYKRIGRRILPLVGTVLLRGIVIATIFVTSLYLGITMLMTGSQPGIIMVMLGVLLTALFLIWYAFISQTVVMEDEGGYSAMKRSKYLAKGFLSKGFVLVILSLVAIALGTEFVSFGIYKVFSVFGQHGRFLATGASDGASNVVSLLLEPFRAAILVFLYFDLRIRKEGFDLEIMSKELGFGSLRTKI